MEIPCIKRLIQRRDELKEEFQDLVTHLKVGPSVGVECIDWSRMLENVFSRFIHAFTVAKGWSYWSYCKR